MPISKSNDVFTLIKSLTSAEKRHFSLHVKKSIENDSLLFVDLFQILEKQKSFDEKATLKELGNISKAQFSNLKRHLYSQIISSLRIVHKEKRANFKVREYIDFAYILYGKGLYLQALKILKKARLIARKHHLVYMQLTIIEFEKKIESRHITRSGSNKALSLISESRDIQQNANHLVKLSNLKLTMHAKYLENGHVKTKVEAEKIKSFYQNQLIDIDLNALGLHEEIHYIQSKVWYNYILMDFASCMTYAKEWVSLLDQNPVIIEKDKDLYMRGIHYILTTAMHIRDYNTHSIYLEIIESFRKKSYGTFNTNSQIISFLYVHTGRLDNIILTGNFHNADSIIPKTLARIKKYSYKLDDHRIMVLYFKFAWVYLGNNNPSKAVLYLNKIINNQLKNLREDLQDYARILRLVCHYEMGNLDILDYLLRSYTQYINKKETVSKFSLLIMKLFDELKSIRSNAHQQVFTKYHKLIEIATEDPFSRRALIHLDILSYIESKINSISLREVIQSKV